MKFLRVVEVLPPLLPLGGGRLPEAPRSVGEFVEGVRDASGFGDVFLVSSVKNPRAAQLSTVAAASLLRERAGVEAAPVIVVRDSNRLLFRSQLVAAFMTGLKTVMLAWGDRFPSGHEVLNSYNYRSLSEAIADALTVAEKAGVRASVLAPVDLDRLVHPEGRRLARSRLAAGADLLLAQPPTTDAGETLGRHLSLLRSAGLSRSVLPGVFPFRSVGDARTIASSFGWKLPSGAYRVLRRGRSAAVGEAAAVVVGLRAAKSPGVYLSTRGDPGLARDILR